MPERRALPQLHLLTSPDWTDYELLDSGNGSKLERFNTHVLIRPEPEAVWAPGLPEKNWRAAQAVFRPGDEENGGHWDYRDELPSRWEMAYKKLKFWAQTSASRHLGVFPEQAAHWDWISSKIASSKRQLQVLNLFGYTGLATLAAAQAGAKVTHLDASRKVVTWGRDNQALSHLSDKPVRWIVDDALKFVQRESRRNVFYDGLILDPPKFGRGPKGEVWEFYKLIPALLQACRLILSPQPCFVVLTAYAVKASAVTLYHAVQEMMQGCDGITSAGELVLQEKSAGRFLSTAIYARWSASDKLAASAQNQENI
jgi:23S rRNA (cytosine1962-C5)-methyltransferase